MKIWRNCLVRNADNGETEAASGHIAPRTWPEKVEAHWDAGCVRHDRMVRRPSDPATSTEHTWLDEKLLLTGGWGERGRRCVGDFARAWPSHVGTAC
jgi:hypothetical protein